MSLFGERCVRCDAIRTRKTFEGVPTCERCALTIEADREAPRSCPNDETAMVKEVVMNVIVDRCPECQGVWLDAGELDVMKNTIESGAHSQFASGMLIGMARG
jgi:hypothetical protein